MVKGNVSSKAQIVRFSQNWNEKLLCNCFSTIRLRNTKKYIKGKKYLIMLKIPGTNHFEELGEATLIASSMFNLDQISDSMAFIDSGMDSLKLRDMLRTMYIKKVQNVDVQLFNMLVFKWDSKAVNFYNRLIHNHFK